MPIAQKHQVNVSSVFGQTAFDAWAKNTQAITAEMADYSKKSFENSAAAFGWISVLYLNNEPAGL